MNRKGKICINSAQLKSPCMKCDERHEACWDHCKKYQEYKRKNDECRNKERSEKYYDSQNWW